MAVFNEYYRFLKLSGDLQMEWHMIYLSHPISDEPIDDRTPWLFLIYNDDEPAILRYRGVENEPSAFEFGEPIGSFQVNSIVFTVRLLLDRNHLYVIRRSGFGDELFISRNIASLGNIVSNRVRHGLMNAEMNILRINAYRHNRRKSIEMLSEKFYLTR